MKRTVLFLMFALAACGPGLTPAQQANLAAQASRPVTCRQGADCTRKWSLATQWVKTHSTYKFQTLSDNVIQTYGPFNADPNSAFTITKVSQGGDLYAFDFDSSCDNMIGCLPSGIELQASFVNFVMGRQAVSLPIAASPTSTAASGQLSGSQQTYQDTFMQGSKAEAAKKNDCKSKRLSGEFKTYAETAQCSNDGMTQSFKDADFPRMDIIAKICQRRLELATKLDQGKITETEAMVQSQQYTRQMYVQGVPKQ